MEDLCTSDYHLGANNNNLFQEVGKIKVTGVLTGSDSGLSPFFITSKPSMYEGRESSEKKSQQAIKKMDDTHSHPTSGSQKTHSPQGPSQRRRTADFSGLAGRRLCFDSAGQTESPLAHFSRP